MKPQRNPENEARKGTDAAALFDELLVVLAIGGDREAADRLARRWHPRLLRTARRLAGAPLAEAVAQDAWLGIWSGLPGLRDPSRFAPWAFGILRRRAADRLGRDIVRRNGEQSLAAELPQVTSDASTENAFAIRQAMDALPPAQRFAAHLFFVEGLTLGEIAQAQGVPLGTAKSRLFHARRGLKAALADTSEGETK